MAHRASGAQQRLSVGRAAGQLCREAALAAGPRGAVSRGGGPLAGLLRTAPCLPGWGAVSWLGAVWHCRGRQRQRVPRLRRHFGGQQRQGDLICLPQACLRDFSLWHTRVGASHSGAFWAHCIAGLLLPCAAGRKLGPDKLLLGSIMDLTADGLAELGMPQTQCCSCTASGSSGAQLHQVSVGAGPGWHSLQRLRPPLKSWR